MRAWPERSAQDACTVYCTTCILTRLAEHLTRAPTALKPVSTVSKSAFPGMRWMRTYLCVDEGGCVAGAKSGGARGNRTSGSTKDHQKSRATRL